MKIKVLFENKNLLVLDKPAGFVVHGDGKGVGEANEHLFRAKRDKENKKEKQKLISDYILKNYKKIKGVGENLIIEVGGKKVEIQKPGIVHRLDKDTTGCLIIAKNQSSFENLKNQFQNRKIKKEYVALVWGHIKNDTGIIDTQIARSKSDFRKKEVVVQHRGENSGVQMHRGEEREAMTRYKVLKKIVVFGEKLTLVSYLPETGRMHQLRIHSKSIGHPIVGDHLYGGTNVQKEKFEKKFFKDEKKVRQLLHARTISFFAPDSGELVKVESPIPKDFRSELLK